MVAFETYCWIWEKEIRKMKITLSGKILRDDKIISLNDKQKKDTHTIISDTIPKFIQDQKGTWIKNPEWSDN